MDTREKPWGEAVTGGGGRQKDRGDDQDPPGYTPGNPPASSLDLALEVFRGPSRTDPADQSILPLREQGLGAEAKISIRNFPLAATGWSCRA